MQTDAPIVKDPEEARQAQHVGLKNVLIAGLVLVVVAFAAIYLFMK